MEALAAQLETAWERLLEDKYASLDDFADQLEATAEWLPWQSAYRESVEKMIRHAREGGHSLAY